MQQSRTIYDSSTVLLPWYSKLSAVVWELTGVAVTASGVVAYRSVSVLPLPW